MGNRWNLLGTAAGNGYLGITKNLISQGDDVNKADDDGWTALHCAAVKGHLDVTKYLISERAEVNKGNNYGLTALHIAAIKGHLGVIKYLLGEGAEVNKGCNYGKTALQGAAFLGLFDVTKYLIGQGAEVKRGDNGGRTALHHAAKNGHLDVTKYLIRQGAEVNEEDGIGCTALHDAAENGHLVVTKYLIRQGSGVNKVDNHGRTALHSAVINGHLDVTKHLIREGAEVNTGGKNGRTALHTAAIFGHLDVTKYMIRQGAEVNEGDNEGWTALHTAAYFGHLDVTKYVISQGAEVNKGDTEGRTALDGAAQKGHLDVTKYLISEGAEVNEGDSDGCTALHIAASVGYLDDTKYLISQGAEVNKRDNGGCTALYRAAWNGHLDVTTYLISEGAEVNRGDENCCTAVHCAAFFGHLDVTKYLISQGAEVNKGDNDGKNVLHRAASVGHLDVIKYLISQGAEVNNADNDGWNALHRAASVGHLDVIKYLISQGAEVNKADNDGRNALHLAVSVGHLDVIKYLISQGVEVNKGDNGGCTLLHGAASNGHLLVIEFLIREGAEVKEVDNNGRTALHSAALNGHLDVTNYLISEGAEVNEGDKDGWTPLHSAASVGHLNVIEYLISQEADVNQNRTDGRTALHWSAQEGQLDVTNYLISQGAEANKGDNEGWTALHHAVQKGFLDVVKVLLAGGAHFDKGDIHEQTPLQLCLILGYQSIADLFIDRLDSKLDETDFTYIHLATQHGHTSTIEKLVSKGADLNVRSTDSQTCLHEAIKLCYESRKIVQETDTLKKISDEYYKSDLSPEKALVFYLLENGAKLDVKDETGNLPIQYAKDEVVKQMILSRLHCLEEIQSYRDEPSAPAIASVQAKKNASQEIKVEDHGVSLFIPPKAVHQNDSCNITITVLRDPPSVDIQDDESMACFGIRCGPPTLIFHQPVKIRIPHSYLVVNPDLVKPDIVSRAWDSVKDLPITSRKRSSNSPDEPPYCRVYKRHLELHIGHCAEWWVLIPFEQRVIRHQLMCTPYIPDSIRRGQEFDIHFQMHADLPGMEKNIEEGKKQQYYRKNHRSVPFSVESKSGDVTVTCHREGDQVESKVLSLKDVYSKMSHSIALSMTPSEDDVDNPEITITITQAGRLEVSRSIAFVIRYTDGQGCRFPSEPPSFLRAVEEVLKSDLPDIDLLTIAQTMTVDQFYDLGVALGFTIQDLDNIEYRRFHDREQAIYDMLVKWRKRQPSGLAAKDTFLSITESLDSPAEEMNISDTDREIPDNALLALGRQIASAKKFYDIGEKLGFNKTELQHIEHRTLYNRKDANIQMLSRWKASQTTGPKAKQTLNLIWKSLQYASKAEKIEDEEEEPSQELDVNSISLPEQKTEQRESVEPEDMDIIRNSDSDGDKSSEDIDLCGGSPSTGEQCSVALPVNYLPLAWELGKALRLDDDVIVGYVAPPDPAAMNRLAWQLLNKWCKRVGSQEKTKLMTKLLQDYNIHDCNAGRAEITRKICTTPDLLDFSQRLDLAASEIQQVISTSVSFPLTSIRHIVLKMLQEWVRHGGTRQKLLEIAQAFRFNDAADKIATEMERHRGFMDPFSHGIIDHNGGELKLGELDIRVSIPAGAIPKGMRSVVTLGIPSRCSSKIPLKDGEVLITPVIECSLTQKLLKTATVALAHCTNPEQYQDDLRVSLYTKLEPGTFGHKSFHPNSQRGFHISEDVVDFPTRHLQLWALASSNFRGVQFTCEVFQRLFMEPSQESTLRICIAHPCNRYPAEIRRRQEGLSEPFYQLTTVIKFSLESKEDDLKFWCLSHSEKVQETVPVRGLLNGEYKTLNFELLSSSAEGEAKSVCIGIEQGTSTLAEQQIPISMEVEPDYGVSNTFGRIKFASDIMVKILSGVVCAVKDARELGYQLEFSHSTVEKYLDRADSSASGVSCSGFREMLCDWRRRVRPNEQVTKLRLALEKAGLSHAAEVLLHET